MKKGKRRALSFLIWFLLTFVLLQIIPSETTPDGEKITSTTGAFVGVFVPIVASVVFNRYFKSKEKRAAMLVQKTKDAERSLFNLLETVSSFYRSANLSSTVAEFITNYETAINFSEKLEETIKEFGFNFNIPDEFRPVILQRDFHWHLRDSMERICYKIMAKSKKEFRNNRSGTIAEYQIFKEDIEDIKEKYFDQETVEFAEKQLSILENAIHPDDSFFKATIPACDPCEKDFDNMNGHEFEYWCANLLKKIGYVNVHVTPGSGDQGVDVLAEKEGIKYAIQCKCYSSDLGNTPVQEVNAGKQMYGCQIGAVMTNRHFTKGAKELASKTGVLLWDRDTLFRFIEISTV